MGDRVPGPDPTCLVVAFASESLGLKNTPPDGAREEQVVFTDSNVHLPLLQRGKVQTVNVGMSLSAHPEGHLPSQLQA